MRKLLRFTMVAAIVVLFVTVASAAAQTEDHISVNSYDSDVDYLAEMRKCAYDGSDYALQVGAIYEKQRNLKIEELEADHKQTNYFSTYDTGEEILFAMKTDRLKAEHNVAGIVYERLHKEGYEDAVIAGVLGNMMAECGGQTLDLQPYIYAHGYYGLCMWSLYFGPDVSGRTVDGQLDYLMGNIKQNMEQFGGSHDYFCTIQDAGQAARYFCAYYERGEGAGVRAKNAYTALSWITA